MESLDQSDPEMSPKQRLLTPVAKVRGVGPYRAEMLAKLGIRTASDLLFAFPRDYLDLSDERLVSELEEGEMQTVRGTVVEVATSKSGFGKTRVSVLIRDASGHLRATWFNQPFISKRFFDGQAVLLSAKPKRRGLMWEMSHPTVTNLAQEEAESDGKKMLPIYSLTEGISQYYMRKMAEAAVEEFASVPEEVFSEALLAKYKLLPLAEALRAIHQPDDQEALDQARRRFIFQELFIMQ
ncbi:MAG: ATP-dependent DNA helicase RecG, partial [Planctomycetes bacterium]|nr:ATP-dependent DNA helicase RecG [Planctomycetota bacterium]